MTIYSIKNYTCGCKIQKRLRANPNDTAYSIDYCPIHKAAPELYEACQLVQSILAVWSLDPNKSPNTILTTLIPKLEQALAKAEGKERTK